MRGLVPCGKTHDPGNGRPILVCRLNAGEHQVHETDTGAFWKET